MIKKLLPFIALLFITACAGPYHGGEGKCCHNEHGKGHAPCPIPVTKAPIQNEEH